MPYRILTQQQPSVNTLHRRRGALGKSGFCLVLASALMALGTPAYASGAASPSPSASAGPTTTSGGRNGSGGQGGSATGIGASHAKTAAAPKTGTSAKASASAAQSAVAKAEAAAGAQAKATGQPVPVDAATTEKDTLTANPNGTFTLTASSMPVRVREHGTWTPVDLDLVKSTDGKSWAPSAASVPVAFSAGGTGPLLTETDPASGKTISVSWPSALPSPAISGNSATYPSVLPGVDLRVEAVDTGYREVLVVHDAAAAADPGLKALKFKITSGSGVDLASDGHGGLFGRDRSSHADLFTATNPMEWDSTPGPLGAAGPDQIPDTGDLAPVTSTASTGTTDATLTLAAGRTGINHPVTYPLYIDPEIQPTSTNYYEIADFGGAWPSSAGATSLTAANGNKAPWNSELELGVCSLNCYYDWDGTGHSTYQDIDYFRFDTGVLAAKNGENPTVKSSQFTDAVNGWGGGSGCSTDAIALHSVTEDIATTHPTWSNQYLYGEIQSGGGMCAGSTIDLNTIGTHGYEAGYTQVNIALTANDQSPDSNKNYWTVSDQAKLTVVFNYTPPAPATPTVDGAVTCTSTRYVSSATPTFHTVGTDINPSPLDVKENFQVDDSTGATTAASGTSGQTASGGTATWTSPALSNATAYEVRASTTNVVPSGTGGAPALTGPYSGWLPFTVLSTPPSAAPEISSFDYPPNQWGQPAGAPGVFTVDDAGASNIAGFAYSIDGGAGSEPVPDTSQCGYRDDGGTGTSTTANNVTTGSLELDSGTSAQIRVPSGLAAGHHTLYVRSFDAAHNASAETSYTFYVAPDYQGTNQPISITNGDTLAASATGTNASLVSTQANCCGITWRAGEQLYFGGTASGQTFTVSFSVPDAGTWQLGANMTTSYNFGQLQFDLDGSTNLGNTASMPFDGYTSMVALHYLDLGTPYLTAGTHTLTVTVVGKNSASSDYHAGIDYLELNPTNRYQAVGLSHTAPTAGAVITQSWTWASSNWSDNQQLMLQNSTAGADFTITFNAPVESDYALGVHLTEADDYGTVRFDLDPDTSDINLDGTATTPIDAYNSYVTAKYYFLGSVHLTAGDHVLKLTVVGADSASINNKYNAGLDSLQVAPVTGATDASLTAAMNNHGMTSDGSTTSASFDLDGLNNISRDTLTAAGLTPGTSSAPGATFSLGGATFTMPQLPSGTSANAGDDNVIADGQTIPLPAVSATGVALLLATTCGNSPQATATIHYTSGGPQASQPTLTSVPDWVTGRTDTAAVVLPYRDEGSGSGPTTANQPKLYEEILPVNPNGTLASITLPVLHSTFLPGICSTDLHLLAIGTRGTAAGPGGTAWVGAQASPMDEAITPAGGSLSDSTLRQSVTLGLTCAVTNTCSGQQVRVHLSNAHAAAPVTFDAATIAAQSSGQATLATPVALSFGTGDSASVTIPAGGDVYSNPVALPATGGGTGALTVSLHIPGSVGSVPIHNTAAVATYTASGNQTGNTDGSAFTAANSVPGQYYLAGIDATDTTATDGTVAVLGDQGATNVPAGGGSTWVDDLPAAMNSAGVSLPGGVVNTSSGGALPAPTDRWNLDEGSGTTAYDSGPGLHNATLGGSPTWAGAAPGSGTTRGSLALDGSSDYALTSGTVLDTTKSFTISAWAYPTAASHYGTIATECGTVHCALYLEENTSGEWEFAAENSDDSTATDAEVNATTPVTLNTWTHVVGVFDANAMTVTLYVNGALVGTSSKSAAYSAVNPLVIGGADYGSGVSGSWEGNLADIRVWNQALTATQVSEVYNDGAAGTLTTANALATLRQDTAGEPDVRDVVLSVGADDVLKGTSEATIENNIVNLVNAAGSLYTQNQSNKLAQVFVTTIAPLGLPATDPREQTRTAVNAWITTTYTNGQSIDIAADTANGGVSDPGNANEIAPTLLTNGIPNAAYYSAIANQAASTISSAIPPIQLIVRGGRIERR